MDAHRSPERPETRKHGHPTAQTRPRSLTEHAARDRGTHTQPHQHCDTNMRRSHCNGSGGGADDGAVGGLRVAPCLRTATTQMVSAAHIKLDAWTWAWTSDSGWANLRALLLSPFGKIVRARL